MTSDVTAKVNGPGPSAAMRCSPGDRLRSWGGPLLAAIPSAAVLTVLLYGLGLAMGFGLVGVIAIVWLVICVLVGLGGFLGAGRGWSAALLGVRAPTQAERPVLQADWGRVARRAGISAESYSLWIRVAERQFALPNRMIAVTPDSLAMPGPELEAVLAQKLGHRTQGRTSLLQFVLWLYNLPLTWLESVFMSGPAAVGSWITARLAPPAARVFGIGWDAVSRVLVACPVIAASTVIVGLPAALALRLAPEVAAYLLVPIVRRIEFRADRAAVDLGYSSQLIVALRDRPTDPESAALYRLSVSAWAPRVSVAERIRHLRDRLDELARIGRVPGPPLPGGGVPGGGGAPG